MNYDNTLKSISLPESAYGVTLCVKRAGPIPDLFGQAPAPASHSAPPAKARRPMTNATCGLSGFLSSPSAALQSSLESRLRRQLDGAGSTLFSLTWRRKATPAGRPYFQLAASALRISDSDAGSWPTPDTGRDETLASKLRQFFVLGVEHIVIGYDHILFLLSLIVVSRFRDLCL